MEIKEEFNSKEVRKDLNEIIIKTYYRIIDNLSLTPYEKECIDRELSVMEDKILEEFDILPYSDDHYEDKELFPAVVVKEYHTDIIPAYDHPSTTPSSENGIIEYREIEPFLKIDDEGIVYIKMNDIDGNTIYKKITEIFPPITTGCVAK